jgi:hypothetical protein
MANLFNAAKSKGPAPKAAKQKAEVVVTDKGFHASLFRLADVNSQMDALKAEASVLTSDVKERAIIEFAKLYKDTQKFPGSFNIVAKNGNKADASLMFIPTDRYLTMDEERFEEVKEKYGEGIVAEEKTTYEMNADLIEKYGEIISDLIENCSEIEEADKALLISAKTTYNVKKGTISDVPGLVADLKKKDVTVTMDEIIEDIHPVYQLKSVKHQ